MIGLLILRIFSFLLFDFTSKLKFKMAAIDHVKEILESYERNNMEKLNLIFSEHQKKLNLAKIKTEEQISSLFWNNPSMRDESLLHYLPSHASSLETRHP